MWWVGSHFFKFSVALNSELLGEIKIEHKIFWDMKYWKMLCTNRFLVGNFLAAVNVYAESSTVTPVAIYQYTLRCNLKDLTFFRYLFENPKFPTVYLWSVISPCLTLHHILNTSNSTCSTKPTSIIIRYY
jgi:hypothetical protein